MHDALFMRNDAACRERHTGKSTAGADLRNMQRIKGTRLGSKAPHQHFRPKRRMIYFHAATEGRLVSAIGLCVCVSHLNQHFWQHLRQREDSWANCVRIFCRLDGEGKTNPVSNHVPRHEEASIV
jgi:hypothetical protein